MLVRQSINSFIRCTDHYGYITNQLTRYDRCYNETGADFLRMLSRSPQKVDNIVDQLLTKYEGVTRDELFADYMEFLDSLVRDKFVIIGTSQDELDANDPQFSYLMENPKTLAIDYSSVNDECVQDYTQDFFLEAVQGRPMINKIQFELSSKCNERCIHCYIPNEKKNAGFDMPLAKVKDIVDQLAEMGGLNITLSGGEALLHKDLLEIVHYCRQKDMMVSILSNLISIHDDQIQELHDANISLIQTSLYSMNPDIHDTITTIKGSWLRTKTAIEKLVAADIPVQISCPTMKANYKGYAEVLDYAKSLKIKAQTDYILMAEANFDTSNLANRISLEETEDLLRDIITHDIDYFNYVINQNSKRDKNQFIRERYLKQPVCGVGFDSCCITANGDVYPCAGWQAMVLGNVYRQSLREIWEKSPKLLELRRLTKASFPQCVDCDAREYCAMCLVRNYNESGGDMLKINEHFCEVAFLNKRIVEEYM